MFVNLALSLGGNAIGLIVAAVILDDMSLNGAAFFIAVGIFTLSRLILQPLVIKISMKHATALGGSSALISTLAALIITDLISSGLSISGFVTWLLATVIVWAAALLAAFILPAIFVRNKVQQARAPAGPPTKTWGA